jgi:hypothetical protein
MYNWLRGKGNKKKTLKQAPLRFDPSDFSYCGL